MLRYLAKRLVSEEPPQAVLSTEVPIVLSAPLKTSLVVGLSLFLTIVSKGSHIQACEVHSLYFVSQCRHVLLLA